MTQVLTLEKEDARARVCPDSIAIGRRFGRLTVTEVIPRAFAANGETGVQVECTCGTVKMLRRGSLVSGNTRSCGCLLREAGQRNQARLVAEHADPPLATEAPGVRPGMRAVLAILAEAGDEGMLAAEIVRNFGEPAARSDRCRVVNTILAGVLRSGRARRSEVPERSPYYLHTLTMRWFITPAGRAALYQQPWGTRRATAIATKAAARQEAGQRREAALQAVQEQGLGPHTPRDIRNKAIRELRLAGVSSEVIGPVFGISGQQVRYICPSSAAPHCSTCSCKEQIAA